MQDLVDHELTRLIRWVALTTIFGCYFQAPGGRAGALRGAKGVVRGQILNESRGRKVYLTPRLCNFLDGVPDKNEIFVVLSICCLLRFYFSGFDN